MLPWWKVILMQKVGCWRMLLTTKKRRRPSTTSAHALSDSDIVSKIFVVVHWRLSNHDHGHTTAASRRWSIAVMILCWWHPFSNNLNCWQWVSAFMVAFFATPAQRSFLVNEDRQPLRTNYDVAIYYSSLYWVRSDPWFFLLYHGLVSSSFHTSINTTLAELAQGLLHQPDCDEWCLTRLEKMIDFPDELLFARSPLTHVDYAEQRTTMLAHSQSLPSYATPAEEPLS